MTMTNIVMEWRDTLDGDVVKSGGLCMTIDEYHPHPWDDEEVEDFYWAGDDDGRVVELADGAAGSEWGQYAIESPETPPTTWVVLPDLPEQYARDDL